MFAQQWFLQTAATILFHSNTNRKNIQSFEFSVQEYTYDELEWKKHLHELKKSGYYTVYVDGQQRGVGGDTPAMAVLKPQYKIPKKQDYEFRIRMVVKK